MIFAGLVCCYHFGGSSISFAGRSCVEYLWMWEWIEVVIQWTSYFLTENNLPGTLNITLCIEYYWISYEQLNILLAGNLLVGVGHDNSWSMYWIVVDILFLYEIPKVNRKERKTNPCFWVEHGPVFCFDLLLFLEINTG